MQRLPLSWAAVFLLGFCLPSFAEEDDTWQGAYLVANPYPKTADRIAFAGDLDWYKANLPKNSKLTWRVYSQSGGPSLTVVVYGSAGQTSGSPLCTLSIPSGDNDQCGEFTATSAGYYYMVVAGSGSQTGWYSVQTNYTSPATLPTISISDVSQLEGSGGGTANFLFTVSLSNSYPQTVTVQYTTNDVTAQAPSDYTQKGETITFTAGQTSQPLLVPVVRDDTYESDETFQVVLYNATNATISQSKGTGTIINDDLRYGTITLTGTVRYYDGGSGSRTYVPARYVEVAAVDGNSNTIPGTTEHTTAAGRYSITISNAQNGAQYGVQVLAKADSAQVRNQMNLPHGYITPTPSLQINTDYVVDIDINDANYAGAWNILDTAIRARDFLVSSSYMTPAQLDGLVLYWHRDSTSGTYYTPSTKQIWIASVIDSEVVSHEYADSVILHEYAHYVEDKARFAKNNPGGTHYINKKVGYAQPTFTQAQRDGMAFSEGWASFFASWVLYVNGVTDGIDVRVGDVYGSISGSLCLVKPESGQVWTKSGTIQQVAIHDDVVTSESELAVWGILWDLADLDSDELLPDDAVWADAVISNPSGKPSGWATDPHSVPLTFGMMWRVTQAALPNTINEFWQAWCNPSVDASSWSIRSAHLEETQRVFVSRGISANTPGITVTSTNVLITTEAGGTAQFTVKLESQPTSNVTIGLSSSDTSEGTVSPASITFTSSNWSNPQTVTVAGVDDLEDDGDISYTIITAPAVSADSSYNGRNPPDVYATNTDDDTLSIVTDVSAVNVPEGATGSFQVKLSAQPSSNVVVSVTRASGDSDISVQSGSSLTFTSSNWNTYQPVTLAAAEDADTSNGQATIRCSTPGLPNKDVTATETDNEPPLSIVTDVSAVNVPEGATGSFQVKLSAQPSSNVVVSVTRASGDSDISVQSGSSLTFTSSNWNTYQPVTLAAAEDADTSNGQATIRCSTPGLPNKDVTATETDNEPPLSIVTDVSAVNVPEGATGSFQVKLSAQPSSNVVVSVTRASGDSDISVQSGSSLTFTSSNWNTYQPVTLAAAEDADTSNGQATIRCSTPGLPNKDVTATETDNEPPLSIVTDVSAVNVPEGATGSFQVKLSAQPSSNVVVSVTRASGDSDISVQSGSSLTFTSSNWNTYQPVTLAAAEDADTSNGQATIRCSTPGLPNKDVTATETDNEPPLSIVTDVSAVNVPEGATGSFQVKLSAQPSSNVVVSVTRASGDSDISVQSGSSLTFTSSNWNTYQPVTLAAAEDADTSNGQATIRCSTPGLPNKDVTATETDNDTESCCGATRSLPAWYLRGIAVSVSIKTAPCSTTQSYAVEDKTPTGWAVTEIVGGTWDAANGKVKFGPFFDNQVRSLSYKVTPPADETECADFTGTISCDGINSSIGGDLQLCKCTCLPHPADTAGATPASSDYRLVISEITAYGACWKTGCNWPVAPSTIPIEYVTKGGYLWKSGEAYHCDVNCDPDGWSVSCWLSGAGPTGLLAARESVAATGSLATRAFVPSQYIAEQPISVTVQVAPDAAVQVYAIEDSPPTGWTVSQIGQSGSFDAVNGKVKWGPFFDSAPRTLTYMATPPMGEAGTKSFSGVASFDGSNQAIAGLSIGAKPSAAWYRDADGDGYGDPADQIAAVLQPAGYVPNSTDCDDQNADVHPGAAEICNELDDNCDGHIDMGALSTFYRDVDGDGYGSDASVEACTAPTGYVSSNTDCDDGNASVHPGGEETAGNDIDENCDGQDTPAPPDGDADGVPDDTDRCPETITGAAVDAHGCAASQRDGDGDGVVDSADECSDTPAGQPVDPVGCPQPQPDSDRDGMPDNQDGCPQDPAKTSPGICGCGQPDTPNCGQTQEFTLKVVINVEGATVPAPAIYSEGSTVQIYAPEPPEGYVFDHWSGDASGSGNPVLITMDRDKTLTANYVLRDDPNPNPVPFCGFGLIETLVGAITGLSLIRPHRRH